MKKIAITGGIGSGKSYVCEIFQNHFDIPIYYSDEQAKKLMLDADVQEKVKELIGDKAFIDGELNKTYIREILFSNKSIKEQIDKIMSDKMYVDFNSWCEKQESDYILFESAILFEKDSTKHFDKIITITVSDTIRKERVLKREGLTEKTYQLILNNQFPDNIKIDSSDFVIDTSDISEEELLNKIKNINKELCQQKFTME